MRTVLILALTTIVIGGTHSVQAQRMDLGKNEYLRACASCHGQIGKGDGPVAKSLTKQPSDLTKLSKNNNGVFPVSRVYDVVDGRVQVIMHGTREMPIWGDRYRSDLMGRVLREDMSTELREAMVRVRILMLIEYLSTLQNTNK
jgi:mono/diheme cytochrome c family protein